MRTSTCVLIAGLALTAPLLPMAAVAQTPEAPSGFMAGVMGVADLVALARTTFITAPVEEGKRKKLARDLGALADELHALVGEKRSFTDLLLEPSPDLNLLRQKMGALRERVSKVETRARVISEELPGVRRSDLVAIGDKLRAGLDEKAEHLDQIYKGILGLQRSSARPDLSAVETEGKRAIDLLRDAIDQTVELRRALLAGGSR